MRILQLTGSGNNITVASANCYGHVIGLKGTITFDALKDQELFVGFVSYDTDGATIYPDALGTCVDLSIESV